MAAVVSRHPVASFFVLALALTRLLFLLWLTGNGEGIPWFTFGPALAGFAVAARAEGRAGVGRILRAMGRWRVGPVWYLVAIGLPVAIQLAAILIAPMLGAPKPNWGTIPPLPEVLYWVPLFVVFSGPLGEEPGWRGFALPRMLETQGALAASLVLGAVWAAWHLPLALVGDLTASGTVNVVLAAVVLTWLWQNTNSVLLAILMHGSHQNAIRYMGRVFEDAAFVRQQWIAVALWALVALAIVLSYGRERFARRLTGEA